MKKEITLGLIIFAIVIGLLISMFTISITTPKFSKSTSSSEGTSYVAPYSEVKIDVFEEKLEEMQYMLDNLDLSRFDIK